MLVDKRLKRDCRMLYTHCDLNMDAPYLLR